jgi:HK97 gp10 family phage protein
MGRSTRTVTWKGAKLSKILSVIQKENEKAVKKALRKSANHVKKRAKEEAPVLTGAFKTAIKTSVTKTRRTGDFQAKVGVRYGDPVFKYAPTVEKRTNLFQKLGKTEDKITRTIFVGEISKTLNNIWVVN